MTRADNYLLIHFQEISENLISMDNQTGKKVQKQAKVTDMFKSKSIEHDTENEEISETNTTTAPIVSTTPSLHRRTNDGIYFSSFIC